MKVPHILTIFLLFFSHALSPTLTKTNSTNSATNKLLLTAGIEISSFGIDRNNELYICDLNGKVYKLAYKE